MIENGSMNKEVQYIFKSKISWADYLSILVLVSCFVYIFNFCASAYEFYNSNEINLSFNYNIIIFILVICIFPIYQIINISNIKITSTHIQFRNNIFGYILKIPFSEIKSYYIHNFFTKNEFINTLQIETKNLIYFSALNYLDGKEQRALYNLMKEKNIERKIIIDIDFFTAIYKSNISLISENVIIERKNSIIKKFALVYFLIIIFLISINLVDDYFYQKQKVGFVVKVVEKEIHTTGRGVKIVNYILKMNGFNIPLNNGYIFYIENKSLSHDTIIINNQSNRARYSIDISKDDYEKNANFARTNRYFWITASKGFLGLYSNIKVWDIFDSSMQNPKNWGSVPLYLQGKNSVY